MSSCLHYFQRETLYWMCLFPVSAFRLLSYYWVWKILIKCVGIIFFFLCLGFVEFLDLWVFITFAKFENCWVAISSGFFLFYPLSSFMDSNYIYWYIGLLKSSHILLMTTFFFFFTLSQCFVSYSFYYYNFTSLIFSSTISNLLSILSSVCCTSDMVAPSLEVWFSYIFNLSFMSPYNFLNIWNTVLIAVFMSLSFHSNTYVISGSVSIAWFFS